MTADSALELDARFVLATGLAGFELHPVAATYSRLAHAAASGVLDWIGSRASLRYRREEREVAA